MQMYSQDYTLWMRRCADHVTRSCNVDAMEMRIKLANMFLAQGQHFLFHDAEQYLLFRGFHSDGPKACMDIIVQTLEAILSESRIENPMYWRPTHFIEEILNSEYLVVERDPNRFWTVEIKPHDGGNRAKQEQKQWAEVEMLDAVGIYSGLCAEERWEDSEDSGMDSDDDFG